MKDILMFVKQDNEYCAQAKDWIRELLLRHPEYADIPLTEIDQDEHPEIAKKYKYYFLPAFFVGGVRVCECPLLKERVAEVFEKAWEDGVPTY